MKKIFTLLFFTFLGLNNINAATFLSVASGTWSAGAATWTVTSGTDSDNIPDSNDDVTISSGHTVILTSTGYFKTLLVQVGATLNNNSQRLVAYGNITNLGSMVNSLSLTFSATSTFSSSSTFTCSGDWYIYTGTLTIPAGVTINKSGYINVTNGKTCSNFGNISATSIDTYTNGVWINNANSSLSVSANLRGNGTLNASANSNTVTYGAVSRIYPSTYYNLTLNAATTKSLTANTVILNDLTLGAGSSNRINMNNFNLTVGGNWTNNANSSMINQGTVTFNGSGTQTISRATSSETITNVVVSGSGTVLLARSLNTQNLTINSGTFDVSTSNFTVNVSGALTNNASINTRSGLFNFNGTSAQTISGSTNTQFYNLTLNNASGLTINSDQSLKNILTVTAGTFNSNGKFTLLSDGATTGIIGSSNGSFSGNMTIQNHISARNAGYHDLSSPVTNTTIMDWDDDLYMSGIGADDGTPGPAGVDGNSGSDSSVYYWNEPTGSYRAVTGSTTPLVVGRGYEIFIGDDLTSWAARTIDTKGTPNFGTQTLNLSYTAGTYAGLNLVGNPYAASVNYSACPKTNVSSSIYILDDSGNYNVYGSNTVIPPLQGFWVEATSTGATLTFTETCKSTTTATNFYRTKPNYGIKLVFSSQMLPFYNENTVNFETNTSLDYDAGMDALYLKSPNKNAPAMYMLTNSDAKLITNTINSEESEVSIPLGIFTPKIGVYNIEPSISNMNGYSYAWIENIKSGNKYNLNSTISINGEENKTNLDYVLRLSKKSNNSTINQSYFNDDIIVFATESNINVKAINANHMISQVAVYDITGKLILEQSNMTIEAGQNTKIDVQNLSTGVYIVSVVDILGNVKTQKIIR